MGAELVPFEYSDGRSYDEQMREALEKALEIQGTVVNDLQAAINCILQMERAMKLLYVPNPHEVTAQYLKNKYNMGSAAAEKTASEARKLLERPGYLLNRPCDNSCPGCHICGVVLDGDIID
jgi:hypothetical protein